MYQEFHSCIAFNLDHQATKLDPFGSQAVYMHPKGAEICDSYTVLQLSRPAKRPKLTPLCGPSTVWTPPRGLSTAIFGDSFEDLSKKRAGVDMWTSVSLLIIERRGVHISWGALGGGQAHVKTAAEAHYLPP